MHATPTSFLVFRQESEQKGKLKPRLENYSKTARVTLRSSIISNKIDTSLGVYLLSWRHESNYFMSAERFFA